MYYKRKKFDPRYLIIFIIVIIAIILVILSFALNKDRKLSGFEKAAKDTSTLVLKVASAPFNFIKNVFSDIKEKNNIYEKYKELKNKESQIDSIIAQNENLQSEINKLKDQLELTKLLSDKVFLNATVVSRNIDYWFEELTIDKGSINGVKKNMAVVTTEGLIGYVSKVSNYSSSVKLLSNDNMNDKISVKIKTKDKYVYGLISKYDSKTNTYVVEGISENVDIPKDADVVTTGMGSLFPSGLLIGKVSEVTTDNFDLSKVAKVKSSVDFNDIDYVSVLKRKDG